MEYLSIIAILTIISGILSLVCLLSLHFVSPEFAPSWRMVSEYALGKNKKLLSLFFFSWGISNILLSILLLNILSSILAVIGILFILLSGVGAIMGGLFDVNHKHHGLVFLLGIPTFIIGSLLIAYQLISLTSWSIHSTRILISTHSVWVSCIIMAVSMGLMFSGFKKAGVKWDKDSTPPEKVPDGVIAVGGYANRLLILCYIFWTLQISYLYLTI